MVDTPHMQGVLRTRDIRRVAVLARVRRSPQAPPEIRAALSYTWLLMLADRPGERGTLISLGYYQPVVGHAPRALIRHS